MISAKNGIGIEDVLEQIVAQIEKMEQGELTTLRFEEYKIRHIYIERLLLH